LQSTKDATGFYESKVEDLAVNLKALEKILQEKNDGLRMIEDGQYHCSQRYKTTHANLILLQCYGRKLSALVLLLLHRDAILENGKVRLSTVASG